MKKFITLLLILLMIIPMFISCSGETKTNAETTVTAAKEDITTEPATEPVTAAPDTETPQTTAQETETTTAAPAAASSITLNAAEYTLDEGYSVFLKATLSPANAAENMSWSSSDSNVAAVDSAGKVTAKSAGKAIITVKSAGGSAAV
jgi:uncharacterized protein YjdB